MSDNIQPLLATGLGDMLKTMEAERQRALPKVYGAIGGSVVLALLALSSFFQVLNGRFSALFVLLLCVAGIALCSWTGYNVVGEYSRAFKYLVLGLLVRSLDEGLTYSAFHSITPAEFEESRLFPHYYDRFRGEDLVEGCLGQTRLKFSEVHAEYKSSDGKNQTWHTIFRGLFFVADFNKQFFGETVVLPDNLQAPLGRFGQTLQALGAKLTTQRGDLVKLEDPDFEREFVVYSTDQIEARYLLSNSLMRRILNFQRKTARSLYVSFAGGKIYVAVPCHKNMFEPSIFRSALSHAPLQEYLNDLRLMTGLVDEFDLNTRIWSKQPQLA
jgi:hypothetical protein